MSTRSPDALPFRRWRALSGSCRGRSHTRRDRLPRGWPPPLASDPPRARCAPALSPTAYLLAQRCSVRAVAQPLLRHLHTQPWRGPQQRTGPRACDDDISRGSFSRRKYRGPLFRFQQYFLAATSSRPSAASSLCISRKRNFLSTNRITFYFRLDPDGATTVVRLIT